MKHQEKNYLFILLALLFITGNKLYCQENIQLKLGAYVDSYLMTDNSKLDSFYFARPYTFLNKTKDQFGLNIAQIEAQINYNDKARAKVALHYGDFVQASYGGFAVEEAYAGFSIFENFWIDAGYYLTHIGGESYLPRDNWLSSHSILTYFEPFYHAGIKASYSRGPLNFSLQVNNGHGIFVDNNQNKSVGAFISYSKDSYTLSYANMIGNEEPEGRTAKLHQLHNAVVYFKPFDLLELKAQVDVGTKEDTKEEANGDLSSAIFYGSSIQARLNIAKHWKTSARLSYINDEEGVYGSGLSGFEASAGIEYVPIDKSYVRIEGGLLQFDKENGNVFISSDGDPINSRLYLGLNLGVWLN